MSVKMRWGAVATAAMLMCAGCGGSSEEGQAVPTAKAVTLEDLLAAPVPELCEHEPGNLANGVLPLQDPRTGGVSISQRSDSDELMVAFGDLTGDGVDEGVLVTACTAGGVAWPATVQVYTGGPTRLGGVDLSDVTHGREYAQDLSVSNGVVHVSWITQGPDEPSCCGTVRMVGELRVTGGNVAMENVRRV